MTRAQLEELVGDLTRLLGVPPNRLNQKGPSPGALQSSQDLAALVKDFLVRTVGMGVEVP